ncbi:PsbP domain-containing protein 5 [Citrus sinensis]|nr:PsbP domain-containing protein 5 [Citrus sinensis]
MASFVDEINAYTYLYPMELPSKKFLFKWVESRKPERYSSAAPLSPNARLRIVSERVDIIDNLIISVTIGPPNVQFLKSKDKSTWNAKDVADSVLSDKSALRVTSSQRMAESSVLDAHTSKGQEPNLYRHYVASTAEREGYLYSISASTLGKQWDEMGPFLEKSVASFHLLPPTDDYVPPYKDPWRFW